MDCHCLIFLPLWFWGICVACRAVTPKPRLWPRAKTAPPVSPRASQPLSALCLNSTSAEATAETCLTHTSWESEWHLAKTEGILWYVDWRPSLVVEHFGWEFTRRRAKCTSHLLAKTWCSWSQWAAGSLTCSGCGATSLAQTEQHQTGGQPEWGLMRLKPHQRLAYLSSLQSTCATTPAWWELKLPQNSPSSCNYSLLSHK